jgi:hypothetical protein
MVRCLEMHLWSLPATPFSHPAERVAPVSGRSFRVSKPVRCPLSARARPSNYQRLESASSSARCRQARQELRAQSSRRKNMAAQIQVRVLWRSDSAHRIPLSVQVRDCCSSHSPRNLPIPFPPSVPKRQRHRRRTGDSVSYRECPFPRSGNLITIEKPGTRTHFSSNSHLLFD